MRYLENISFYLLRALGGFRLAQLLTRSRLRILCYHGFAVGDEYEVSPRMFMRAAIFEQRMRILKKRGIPVIRLGEAVDRLQNGTIHDAETVITLDDGWRSNLTIGAPILEKYGFPASIYVTTEHLEAGTEVFNVALHYMIRRSPRATLRLEGLHPQLDGAYDLRKDPVRTTITIIAAAERAFPSLLARQRLLTPIAAALELDLAGVLCGGRFSLLDREEIRELSARSFDIQLHTHAHRLPDTDFGSMAREMERNRAALQAILGEEKRHFCYPSGEYSPQQIEWLKELRIASATTCDPGLNRRGASVMLLKRYLDSDCTSDLHFEAEICGVRDLLREARSSLRRLAGRRRQEITHGAASPSTSDTAP